MRQHAVVLTFPAHFNMTKLCVQSIKTHFPEFSSILVLVDDTSNLAWTSYYEDCAEFYSESIVTTRPISTCVELSPIIEKNSIPWIKQQFIKLHLDLLFPYKEIFFTDGDIIFENHIPYNSVPYTNNDDYQGYTGIDFYTSNLLGIQSSGITAEIDGKEKRIDTAATPFRDINLSTLTELRAYVERVNMKNFLDLHDEIVTTNFAYVSEWELFEVYKKYILKQCSELLSVNINNLLDLQQYDTRPQYAVSTLWEHEKMLGRAFWDNHGICITDSEWDKLPNIKYW